ncbi:MAG TPA: SDR family NAD(P)-dependent oxidoreductase, partial [Thermoanaerobaculia bacterium]
AAAALAAAEGRIEGTAAAGRQVAFLLPGLGDHYPGMARGLYESEPAFRREFDRCADLLAPRLGADLREAVLAAPATAPAAAGGLDLRRLVRGGAPAGGELARTALAQPAVFAVEYALARLWMEWGIEPRAMLGYSLGEYVAACLAGVFTLEDALALVAERARLIESAPAGAMLAVPLGEEEAMRRLGDDLSLAAVNGPALSVVAGSPEAVARIEGELAADGVPSRRLLASHAFHSHLMDGLGEALVEQVAAVPRRAPRIPWVSNLTGDWIGDDQATDPRYWAEHMRRPVRFADGLARLAAGGPLLLEVGPGCSLSSLAVQALGEETVAVASMRHAHDPEPDQAVLLRALGRLWAAGAPVDWNGFWSGERRRRVSLPGTPFERRRYWVEAPEETAAGPAADERAADPGDWLYAPGWRSVAAGEAPAPTAVAGAPWLVLGDPAGAASRLAAALDERGERAVCAAGRHGDTAADLGELLGRFAGEPLRIVDAGDLDGDGDAALDDERGRGAETGLVALAAALAGRPSAAPVELTLLTRGAFRVESSDPGRARPAALAALGRVLRQEQPGVVWRHLDLPADDAAVAGDLDDLVRELRAGGAPTVALRGDRRWAPLWQPHAAAAAPAPALPAGAVVLVTGGLGRLGAAFARRLAEHGAAGLVLTGRRPLGEGADDPRHDRVRRLEALGVEVLARAVDVADEAAMAELLAAVDARFGRLDGVVHAAGVVADDALGFLAEADAAALDRHFRPKVEGLRVLDRLLGGRPLALRWLLSSISTLLGGLRLGPYSAANAVLDAHAEAARPAAGAPWLSLAWGEVFAEAEVAAVVDRALAVRGARRLAVSPTPLEPRLRRALAPP